MKTKGPTRSKAAFERFQRLTKRLLRVSKAEVDQKRREYEDNKAKKQETGGQGSGGDQT